MSLLLSESNATRQQQRGSATVALLQAVGQDTERSEAEDRRSFSCEKLSSIWA